MKQHEMPDASENQIEKAADRAFKFVNATNLYSSSNSVMCIVVDFLLFEQGLKMPRQNN